MDVAETQALTQLTHDVPLDDKVGFLLVEGYMEYPIKKGVTMIGRDRNKCDIVLDDESVSKVHAVIRIKKASEFFLIDMNSTNGTKCKEIPLKPQFPTQFHYDEKIEFGSVFALLRRGAQSAPDEECNLPMTQVLDTPARHRPTENSLKQLTIPESPNVSDKDDSFLMPSRPPAQKKSLENNKTTPKNQQQDSKGSSNDSLFWKAPSRSPSLKFDLDESTSTINDSGSGIANHRRETEISIHEMETQLPYSSTRHCAVAVSIHDAETQIHPDDYVAKKSSDESNEAIQTKNHIEINEMETQLVYSSTHKSAKDISIYDAETQIHPDVGVANVSSEESNKANQTKRHIEVSESDEEILCEEFDTDDFEVPNSQAIEEVISRNSPVISETIKQPINVHDTSSEDKKQNEHIGSIIPIHGGNKDVKALHSDDDSTDCEDEPLTCSNKENVTNHNVSSMNITATCSNFNVMDVVVEESDEECVEGENKSESHILTEIFHTHAHEIKEAPTQIGSIDESKHVPQNDNNIDDLPTQIIALGNDVADAPTEISKPQNVHMQKHTVPPPTNDGISDELTQVMNPENDVTDAPTQIIDHVRNNVPKHVEPSTDDDFCDAPTQIIDLPNNNPRNVDISDALTQIIPLANDENNTPSRVMATEIVKDTSSPFKIPMKAFSKLKVNKQHRNAKSSTNDITRTNLPARATDDDNYYAATQDIVTDLQSQGDTYHHYKCTQDVFNDLQTQNEDILFRNSSKSVSPILSRSPSSGTDELHVKNVFNLSPTKVRDIVGAAAVDAAQKIDVSDLEDTPRKEFDFDELPLSEDISQHKTTQRTPPTAISSEEEIEQRSSMENSDSDTPIVFKKKKRINKAKVNLTKRLDPENMPSRISTRTRKPTEKMKELVASIEPEESIEAEIIKENLAKLKGEKSEIFTAVISAKSSKMEEKGRLTKGVRTSARKESPSANVNINMDVKRGPTKKKEAKALEKSDIVKEYTRKSKELFKTSISNKDNVKKHKDEKMDVKSKRETKRNREIIKEDVSSTDSEDEAVRLKKRRPLRTSKKKIKDYSEKTKPKRTTSTIDSSTESDLEAKTVPAKGGKSQRKTKVDSANDSQKQDIQSAAARIPSNGNRNIKILNPGTESQNSDSQLSTRRSNRQKNNDSDSAKNTPIVIIDKIKMPQRVSKNKDSVTPKYDQSLAYSMIDKSDSSVDSRVSSPQPTRVSHRKRGADSEVAVLTPSKKLRSSTAQHSVLFTAYDIVENRNVLHKLGAEVVEDPKKCTVVVTKQVKRTIKFLCAVSLGRPIVGDSWVQACRKAKELVDPWPYLLEDADSEKKFRFSLRKSLRAQRHYLAGYNVTSTPKALPPPHEIKVLVECSGGKWKEGGKNWIVISNAEDKALWPSLRQRGAVIVSNEFILSGVLKQTADLQAYKLSG